MHCNHCGRVNVPPSGPSNANILLVANAPTKYDVKAMRPWTGDAGRLLQTELRRAGMIYNNCRVTNMWQHKKVKECDLIYHVEFVLEEMKDRPVVILMGADTVSYFTVEKVSEVSGLRVGPSPRLPKSIGLTYAIFNPAIAMHDKLGEIRWGLKNIKENIDVSQRFER